MKKFFLCYFETTRNCNLSCPYCMSRLDTKPDREELTTEEIKHKVIDEVKKFSPYAAMAFSGGEFITRPDAIQILEYTAKEGLWAFINTNATLLNEKYVKEVAAATNKKAVFVFSFNSTDKKIHWWSRDDHIKTILSSAKLCYKYGMPFFFIITISKNNLKTLNQTMSFLQKKGIPMLRSPFVLRGSGKNYKEFLFTKEEMKNIIHPILRDNHLSYVSYAPFFASPELINSKTSEAGVSLGQLGCQAAKGFIGISPEGEVAPCVHLLDSSVKCGNVRDRSLHDILVNNDILNELRERKTLKGKCAICRYKHTCGGCRALAYYHTGDYLAEDPVCFFEPEDANTVSEFEPLQSKKTGEFIEFLKKNDPWKSLF